MNNTIIPNNGEVEGFFSVFFGNIDIAVIVLLVSLIVGKLISVLLNKLFLEIQLDKNLNNIISKKFKISKLLSNFVRLLIYGAGIIYSLVLIGIWSYIVNFIGVLILIIVLGTFILAVRDFLPNLIAGFWTRKKIDVGEPVFIGNIQGEIESFDLLSLTIISGNDKLIIPYSVFQEKRLKKSVK